MPKFSECHSFLVSSEEVNNGPAHSETKQKIPILIPILILILFSCQVGNTTFTGDQRVSVQVGNPRTNWEPNPTQLNPTNWGLRIEKVSSSISLNSVC